MTRPPVRLIEWEDAYNGMHDWTNISKMPPKPAMIVPTVLEITRDTERVTLAMSYGDKRPERPGATPSPSRSA